MIGDSLTTDNLLDILKAMTKIEPIDQSKCYKDYLYGVEIDLRFVDNSIPDYILEQMNIIDQNKKNDKDSKH